MILLERLLDGILRENVVLVLLLQHLEVTFVNFRLARELDHLLLELLDTLLQDGHVLHGLAANTYHLAI